MLIRKIAVAVAVMMLASSASALDVTNLVALTAMPLAVAEAADLPRVPQQDLIDLVTQLNAANVPPAEFIQIVRYVPVALVDQNGRTQIVDYVTTETRRGVAGPALATSVADELRLRYDVPRFELAPTETIVVTSPPPVVVERVNDDLLSLVAMPVAVAAVSQLAGIPQRDLIDFVTQLNTANVPPVQFVEVVQTAPVALIDTNTSPQFVQYVTTQVDNGIRGPELATVVTERLRTQPAPHVRIAQFEGVPAVRVHPHGGPPGQLKKVYGLQTGAEIVHGTPPPGQVKKQQRVFVAQKPHGNGGGHGHGRGHQQRVIAPQPVFVPQPMISSAPPPPGNPGKGHGHGGGNPHGGPPGNPGHGGGKGHGKGKG